jgi:hypothetical protein
MNDPQTRFQDPLLAPASPAAADASAAADEQVELKWLIIAAVVTVLAWRLPNGHYIVYPFTILATWFHEMGHGLAAMLTGGRFEKLVMLPDGSGIATNWISNAGSFGGRFTSAFIAAGGLLGPPVAGAIFILCSRRYKTAHTALLILGSFIVISVLIWVRSLFGLVAMGLWGFAILGIAMRGQRWLQAFSIQLLGVQACLSTFQQLDYLFSPGATIGGQTMPSDSMQIAQNLLLPYWFWGGLIAVLSAVLLLGSLYVAYRPARKTSVAV